MGDKAPRTTRTPEQRALEAFGIAERKADKAAAAEKAAKDLYEQAARVRAQTVKALEYAGLNPDLPESIREQFAPTIQAEPTETEDERQAANGNGTE